MEKQTRFRNTVKRRNYKFLNNEGANIFVENKPNESLKPERRMVNFSFLTNLLPANHYNHQRQNAMTRRNRGIVYPYAQQNAENVGRVMETANTELQAQAGLNRLYPNQLTPEENTLLQKILNRVRQGVNREIVQRLNTQFVQTGTPISPNVYLFTVSQITKKYLKIAIAQIQQFRDWQEEVKIKLINQLRKRIMIEKMRKGWFEYSDSLI